MMDTNAVVLKNKQHSHMKKYSLALQRSSDEIDFKHIEYIRYEIFGTCAIRFISALQSLICCNYKIVPSAQAYFLS